MCHAPQALLQFVFRFAPILAGLQLGAVHAHLRADIKDQNGKHRANGKIEALPLLILFAREGLRRRGRHGVDV